MRPRYQIVQVSSALVAIEPTPTEIAQHAATLMAAYNDPHNAPLLGHTEAMTEAEVVESYSQLVADGGYSFMVFRAGELIADGDLRNVGDGAAELAFLVTDVRNQGQGLGTRFATMLQAFGFRQLELDRIYASVLPSNVASRRVFEKLGYVLDESAVARGYADAPGDVVLRLDRARFVDDDIDIAIRA